MSKENLGEFEQLVLLALRCCGEASYGVPIHRLLQERVGRRISLSAVHTTLDRLERKGFVSSQLGGVTPERGGRAKRYYKLEATGDVVLDRALEALSRLTRGLISPAGAL
jgi:DNA-binding PadR family transcriptional regulator